MNHSDPTLQERLASYALGAMEAKERAAFERELDAHLAGGCAECERALAEYSEAVVALARSTPRAAPSEALRSRVLAAVENESRPKRPARTRLLPWAAVLIVGLTGAAGWLMFFDSQRRLEDREQQLVRLEQQLDLALLELKESGRIEEFMMVSQTVELVPLAATEPDRTVPAARVLYDRTASRAVAVFVDATPPEGHDYQLWALGSEGVQSLGVLRADDAGRAEIDSGVVASANQLQGFAISLEPEGGSPDPNAPSGPVISVGLRG